MESMVNYMKGEDVMTCADLIIYILQNDLINEPVFKDGKFVGFVTENEVAIKMGVGVATVRVWMVQEKLDHIHIGDTVYIPANYEPKLREKLNAK